MDEHDIKVKNVEGKWLQFERLPFPEYELTEIVVDYYEMWIKGNIGYFNEINLPAPPTIDEIKQQLAGKDLICFCNTNNVCHADVLLKIANA